MSGQEWNLRRPLGFQSSQSPRSHDVPAARNGIRKILAVYTLLFSLLRHVHVLRFYVDWPFYPGEFRAGPRALALHIHVVKIGKIRKGLAVNAIQAGDKVAPSCGDPEIDVPESLRQGFHGA